MSDIVALLAFVAMTGFLVVGVRNLAVDVLAEYRRPSTEKKARRARRAARWYASRRASRIRLETEVDLYLGYKPGPRYDTSSPTRLTPWGRRREAELRAAYEANERLDAIYEAYDDHEEWESARVGATYITQTVGPQDDLRKRPIRIVQFSHDPHQRMPVILTSEYGWGGTGPRDRLP